MLYLTVVLLLAAVLDRSIGEEESEEEEEEEEEEKGEEEEEEAEEEEKEEKEEKEEEPVVANPAALQELKAEKKEEEEEEEEEEDGTITGSGVIPDQQKIIVDKHNEIRRKVEPTAANMLKMVWNETVGETARMWAEKCTLGNSPEESRKLGDMPCGETIFQSNQVTLWPDVIDFWMNGRAYFKYGTGATDPRKNIFAYTQIIWYNSHIIGCAVGHCPESTFPFAYICHYCPGGNLMSKMAKPYKEGPSCGDCPKACEDKLCTNPCQYADTAFNCRDMKKVYSCKSKLLIDSCKATCKCKKKIL